MLFSSISCPIISVVADAPMAVKLDIAVLPKTFSNSPTVELSDLLIDKFLASLYSPLGIIRESRSWFILPLRKVFLTDKILLWWYQIKKLKKKISLLR